MIKIGIFALALVALSGMASAATVAFGTFSFANFGTGAVTFTNTPAGNSLGANTSQIVLPGQIITSLLPMYLGETNSFCNTTDCGAGIQGPDPTGRLFAGESLAFQGGTNTINIAGGLASAIDFLFSSGVSADRYGFLATGPGVVTTPLPGFLLISYAGNFTDANGFFFGQSGAVSFTFTQASPGATVAETASFSTPAAPEPASMALIGGGLIAIGLVARKTRKKA
jgi:hypothetical protein